MPDSVEKEHHSESAAPEPESGCSSRELQKPGDERPIRPHRVVLSWLTRLGLEHLVDGEKDALDALIKLVSDSASALAGPDGADVRRRMLSKSIATCRAQCELLDGLLAEQVRAGNEAGVRVVDRALNGCTKRLVHLFAEHRASTSRSSAPVVAVAHVGTMVVKP